MMAAMDKSIEHFKKKIEEIWFIFIYLLIILIVIFNILYLGWSLVMSRQPFFSFINIKNFVSKKKSCTFVID
jgi:TRAP-type C4-dicarboxylate transport system permease small subunit